MHEATTSRERLTDTTTSALVPGAHIEVAFQKLGRDVSRYVKGSGAYPYSIGNNRGYYNIESLPVLPESLPDILETLYRIHEGQSELASEIATSLIENLTTKNDLTNEEVAWLVHIAENGGQFELTPVLEATPGMSRALGKIKFAGSCSECDFKIPKYSGRYPKCCPECGCDLDLARQESQEQLTLGTHREDIELASRPLSHIAEEVYDALYVLNERLRLVSKFGLKEELVHKSIRLPEEATYLQKTLVGESEQATPQEIFEHLVAYTIAGRKGFFDNLVRHLFAKFPLEEGMVERLREEVAKRKPLCKSITSLSEMEDEERKYFTLNKALSSCYTRVMIEGETMGGESYKLLGKCIFEMMQRALEGDLQGPTRFLNLYFLEG